MASTYLTRTFGTPTNGYKYTISFWVKRSKLGVDHIAPMTAGTYGGGSATNMAQFLFTGSDNLLCQVYNAGGTLKMSRDTNRKFRDTNAWYHIVLGVDGTLGTAADRQKLYVNGVQETSFDSSTNIDQNADMAWNQNGIQCMIGNRATTSYYFDGCLSHVHFIDGTQYAASDFGETDATTGIWKPKTAPSVTYGNNGFFLKFENSGAMGTDSAGSNDFTVNGPITQLIDTPSNVFATFNPLNKVYMNSISNNNNTIGAGNNGTDFGYIAATIGASSGKYYWEAKVTDLAEIDQVGVALASSNFSNVFSGDGLQQGFGGKSFQFSNGNKAGDGSQSAYMGAFSANDIAMIALDLDNNKITFGRNGQWSNGSGGADQTYANSTAAFTNLTAGEVYTPAHAIRAYGGNTGSTSYNFGNGYFGTTAVTSAQNPDDGIGIFEYDVPAGFRALCTKSINAEEYS